MNAPTQTAVANFDNTVDAAEFKFRFKTDKLGNTRPAFKIDAKVPSVEGIMEVLSKGGNGLKMLLEVCADTLRGAVAADVSENEKFDQGVYDSAVVKVKSKDENGNDIETEVHRYSWEGIANLPKEDRRSIPAEAWEAFSKAYLEIMPAVANKTQEQVGNAIQVYLKKFAQVKTNKPVLSQLKQQLGLFIEHCKNADDFVEILELLDRKADEYLKSDDIEKLVSNL